MAARQRSSELCERLVQNLLESPARPFGVRGGQFDLRLARVRPLVRLARREFREWLEGRNVPTEVVGELTLAFSEALANAVEHPQISTRQIVQVKARCEDNQVELRVRDFGSWREHSGSDLRGRGLPLIAELMDSLDVQQDAGGTNVVMRRSI
jgi:anti-sigma regulatory factor (Ser/Thr protein kinase)